MLTVTNRTPPRRLLRQPAHALPLFSPMLRHAISPANTLLVSVNVAEYVSR